MRCEVIMGVLALALAGCNDDGTTAVDKGAPHETSVGREAGVGMEAGVGTEAGVGKEAGGIASDGGNEGGPAPALFFCAAYLLTCGFGATDHYTNMADCTAKYSSYSSTRKACVGANLALAKSKTAIECTYAAGLAPCD